MTQFENIKALAKNFITFADTLNENVTNYINGSNAPMDVDAYNVVKNAYKSFVTAYNAFYEENHDDCFDYELAESVLL